MNEINKLIVSLQMRTGSYSEWMDESVESLGANMILKQGEIAVCEAPLVEGVAPTVLLKVGDGQRPFKDLNWISALAADVSSWAKADILEIDEKILKFKKGNEVIASLSLENFIDKFDIATNNSLGIVKGVSDTVNKISLSDNGEMEVNGISIDKLQNKQDYVLVLSGGTSRGWV